MAGIFQLKRAAEKLAEKHADRRLYPDKGAGERLREKLTQGGADTATASRAVDAAEPTLMDDAQQFHDAVADVKGRHTYGDAVELKSPEDYVDTKKFLSGDSKSGFAIKPDGDLVSVFSDEAERGRLAFIMEAANRWGAKKLDAFDIPSSRGGLPEMYGEYGYYPTDDPWPWNEQFAPEKWNRELLGEPPVQLMGRTERSASRFEPQYSEPEFGLRRPGPLRGKEFR